MNLQEIFAKPVDRPIEGVIKADALDQIKLEAEEYVITNEIAKRLGAFFNAYNDYQGANGAWISGFFGSGKSHLLKMLAFLLENKQIDGTSMLEMFLPKCEEDAMLKGAMKKAASIPSKSILFNIDQKADTISKEEHEAVLHVFMKVFNEMQGYYGKQGYVAQFEREMDKRGIYQDFKQAYPEIAGHSWEKGREQVILDSTDGFISEAYAQVTGSSMEDAQGIINRYRGDYKVSIEDFAEMVHEYIEEQDPGFRLNFFVDEVGQYVADHVKLMTNLQTIAESLATKCKGKAWLIVTAQEDMDIVMGEMGKQQSDDFSKIMDRFQTRMKLTSANVDEVIQKRLLKKKEEAKPELGKIYRQQKNNFGTLFSFSEDTMHYRQFRDREGFIQQYPFIPYQFTLFQSALITLSKHNAFEGQHSSVGERSMLGVFQQVVKEIADNDVGTLATFDLMFEGIRTALKAQTQRSIITAENNLNDPFAVRVLKALFLVKYVKEFTASPRNLRVLMQDRFDLDLTRQQERIKEALEKLERQTYIQRTGDEYEYLTDEEKDIEEEIKNEHIDQIQMVEEIGKIFFDDVIRTRKLHYEETDQDFEFTRKLDDRIMSREKELAIHLVTPFHENVDNISVLQGHSMGKAELMVVMPPDPRLIDDLRMYKKTAKYIRQNRTSTQQDTVQRILSEKGFQNQRRQETVRNRIKDLLSKSKVIISGNEVQVNGSDPLTRVHKGFEHLIQTTYTNLNMLQGVSYSEDDIHQYLEMTQEGLFADEEIEFSEAEQELLAFIQRGKREGIRTTLKKVVDSFGTKPYGWDLAAVQCLMAKLIGKGKVELRADGNLLEEGAIESALKNTHQFNNVIVIPQVEFTAGQKRRLKDFFGTFFDRPPEATDARSLGKETREAFQNLHQELEQLIGRKKRYPFLAALEEPAEAIRTLKAENYTYFLTELTLQRDELFDLKEKILDPVRRFMEGTKQDIYDQARSYLEKQEPNFSYIDSDLPQEIREIIEDPHCYQGSQMRDVKDMLEDLMAEVEDLVEKERKIARDDIDRLWNQFQNKPQYEKLSDNMKTRFKGNFERAQEQIEVQYLVAVIRDTHRRIKEEKYNQYLSEMDHWVRAQKGDDEDADVEGEKAIEYITSRQLEVDFQKTHLENEDDVKEYLAKLGKAMLRAIRDNKHIQI